MIVFFNYFRYCPKGSSQSLRDGNRLGRSAFKSKPCVGRRDAEKIVVLSWGHRYGDSQGSNEVKVAVGRKFQTYNAVYDVEIV